MKITITDEAINWFKDELDLQGNESVQFFVRYGGSPQLKTGFSLGLAVKDPENIGSETIRNGIRFYVEDDDLWYFEDHDFDIHLDEKWKEIRYHFPEKTNE
ncbi:HesB/YadR/YfhF family protein [Texcoconibacillus texcoconensis]|uniref:Uncharacterized protein YneR n=1 Tax=Texcoconibacillus texcoconensis TaxID=1095777 RepID=A0A840QTG8_9BACI|nr:HesB/YadR/YfhF family protein [Texcoconibacillus texcoconensis]MBB5174812.1 uncharacterized protein YneR [Texcoconibacillus texcoconensis]